MNKAWAILFGLLVICSSCAHKNENQKIISQKVKLTKNKNSNKKNNSNYKISSSKLDSNKAFKKSNKKIISKKDKNLNKNSNHSKQKVINNKSPLVKNSKKPENRNLNFLAKNLKKNTSKTNLIYKNKASKNKNNLKKNQNSKLLSKKYPVKKPKNKKCYSQTKSKNTQKKCEATKKSLDNKICEQKNEVTKQVEFSDQILASKILSLIFTNNPKLKTEEKLKEYKGIKIEGIDIRNKDYFCKKLSSFLGKPLTLKSLSDIREETLNFFKCSNCLVDVKILENQNVATGKLQIYVQFAKLGEVKASGAKYFSNCKIAKNINICKHECVDVNKLKRYLSSLNKNPFRDVSIVLEPGSEVGYTNLHFRTKDKIPLRAYLGYENTGNQVADQSRIFTGLNFGNFLGLDHQANIQFTTAPSIEKWWGIVGNYYIPTFSSTYLKFTGSYVKTKPKRDDDYTSKGKSWSVLSRYHIPLDIFTDGINELVVGYDFKSTNNFIDFIQTNVFKDYIDISQFVMQFSRDSQDRLGATSFLLSLYFSPGKMTKDNKDSDYRQEGNAKKSQYFYATLHLDRTFNLPRKFLYVMNFMGQASTTRLLPTEQISLGGFNTIRGYQENEAYGDFGFYFRNELRYTFSKIKNDFNKQCQPLIFTDLGYVSMINDNVSDKNSSFLGSVGPGLRITMGDNFIVKLDYGVQLKNFRRKYFDKPWDSRLHVYGSLQF